MPKLTKREAETLRAISAEPRPCTCQFPRYGGLERKGLVTSDACNVTGHGGVWITDAGRAALEDRSR